MIYVTKNITFSASHRLYNPNWTHDKNEEVFDKCNNPNGHGHNYILEVTIEGIPNLETGYVIDLKKLKKIMMENIEKHVDHKHLNYDVPFLKGIIPTVENIAVVFWQQLENKIEDGKLFKIKLYETDSSYVEYFGEPIEIKTFDNL